LKNRHGVDHSDFLEVALMGRSFSRPLEQLKAALQIAQSAGKPRPLTTFSADGMYLRPLHKTIYDRLSKQSWLSRGDVTSDSLRRAGFKASLGGLLTSGDYASATDNLSIEVMECAIETMLENAAVVPPNIREFAVRACRPFLYSSRDEWVEDLILGTGSKVGVPRKGQMMGSYLSFPLLCLQNFLAFRWATRQSREKIPVLINGDDILFQSSEPVSARWMETVGRLGLVVERTKTSVASNYGTLNSTLVEWEDDHLVVTPTLRFGMLRPAEYPCSLGKSFSNFIKGITGPIRWRAGRAFFEAHLGELKSSAFSMPSLGFEGALALRLSKVFGLLGADRLIGETPRAPVAHSVCLPPDLISEVPNEFVDSDVVELSSCETASWKWSVGFSGADKVTAAIRYAISSTKWTCDPCPLGEYATAAFCSDREFAFRYQGGGRLERGVRPSRKEIERSFRGSSAPRLTTRLFYRVVAECMFRTDSFGCPLPTYEEAVGG
jgi:hypothetical protein